MAHSHLRPLDFGEILDGAFSLYRRNFAPFFLTAVLPMLPIILLWLIIGSVMPSTADSVEIIDLLGIAVTPYTSLATLFIWAALIHEGASAYAGEEPSWRRGYRAAVRRLIPLIGAAILVMLMVGIGFVLLFVPGILAAIICFAVLPAVVLEQRGPVAAIRRSRDLARGAWGRIFLVLAVFVVITALPPGVVGAAGALGLTMTQSSGGSGVVLGLMQALATLLSALVTPLFALGVLLLYYDRRVRAEGLDLEIAAEDLSPAE